MDQTVLQIRLDKNLKNQAEAASAEMGFSSLQENIRVYIKQLAKKTIDLTLQHKTPSEQLSPAAVKRYDKMIKDIESGKEKTYSFNNVDDAIKFLHSDEL